MTREEEIQKYADELAQQYFPDEYNVWVRENVEAIFVSEACMKMAKYVEQKLIEKGCKWLNNMDNIEKYLHVRTTLVDDLAKAFRKEMEE